jgi:N-methylhydantoinase A
VQLANANIVRATQLISTERGHDPRDYVMVPYGGGGPLHAAHVAEELSIATIVVPPCAGVISAYGLIASDFMQFDSLTRRAVADAQAADIAREVFAEMKARAHARARELGLKGRLELSFVAYMRFVGQAFEVPVSFAEKELARLTPEAVRKRFNETHQRIFFFGGDSTKPCEFVSFRMGLTLPLAELPLLEESDTGAVRPTAIDIYDGRAWQAGVLRSRASLGARQAVKGPALLEDPTSTLLVPKGWTARRDAADNTILERKG